MANFLHINIRHMSQQLDQGDFHQHGMAVLLTHKLQAKWHLSVRTDLWTVHWFRMFILPHTMAHKHVDSLKHLTTDRSARNFQKERKRKTKDHCTHLFPHLGMPTLWMMVTTTWAKKMKKKKKKLKELSVLKETTKHLLTGRELQKPSHQTVLASYGNKAAFLWYLQW